MCCCSGLLGFFEGLNKLNWSLQGKQTHQTLSEKVSALIKKLDLWETKGNFDKFDQLCEFTDNPENAENNKQLLINLITKHI